MPVHRNQYDEDFQKNAVELSCASPKSVRAVAENLGIAENVRYNWRKKYTAEGYKTPMVTLEEELIAIRLENAELKMELDMLNRAGLLCEASEIQDENYGKKICNKKRTCH